jgi:hypothetical protein
MNFFEVRKKIYQLFKWIIVISFNSHSCKKFGIEILSFLLVSQE